jgi:hypothetical protein
MRALIVSTLMTLGLTGGVAAADNYRSEPHHEVYRERYRDYRVRPALRYERHDVRRGYRWVGGEWRWYRGEWIWAPGHYIRIARW